MPQRSHTQKVLAVPRPPKVKIRKMAILLGYSGTGYLGMQLNPGVKTIEADIFEALGKAGMIKPEFVGVPRKVDYQRTARTDKGVHAARQVRVFVRGCARVCAGVCGCVCVCVFV